MNIPHQEIISDYLNIKNSNKSICDKFNINEGTLYYILRRYNVERRYLKHLTKIQRQQFIKDYQSNKITIKELSNKYKISPLTGSRLLKRYNIKIKRKKLSKKEEKALIKDYLGDLSLKQIKQKYDICDSVIYDTISSKNIKTGNKRKYKINLDFFKRIDTESKAYFLGLLYADGCNNGADCTSLTLQEQDKHILIKLKKDIKTNFELKFHERSKINPKWKNTYHLELRNKVICEDLIKLGCMPNKTYKLKFPTESQVPKHLLSHFMRGVWDGDGTIGLGKVTKQKYNYAWCTLSVTKFFINDFIKFIEKELQINCTSYKPKITHEVILKVSICGPNQIKKFLNWLYCDANIYLKRKYKKYKLILKTFMEKEEKI